MSFAYNSFILDCNNFYFNRFKIYICSALVVIKHYDSFLQYT